MSQDDGRTSSDRSLAFSSLSGPARSIWSKSAPEDGEGHNLLAHLLDVAAVAETLLEREPESTLDWASRRLSLPREACLRWVAALAGLHDFGKAIPGFAIKWPAGRTRVEATGLGFSSVACRVGNHSKATSALLAEPLHVLTNAPLGWVDVVVQAIAAHHGFHFSATQSDDGVPFCEPAGWAEARREILEAYWLTLASEDCPSSDTLDLVAVNWLAGLTSTADWIASNPDWFSLGERHDNLADYYDDAKQLAEKALESAGWHRAPILLCDDASAADLLTQILGQSTQPRALQLVGDALLRSARGPSLLLVEAPMGEGKTELAYLAYLRLQAANAHRGLYVALPTQATGNALFDRTRQFLDAFVVDKTDIQLVHGGAALNEQIQHLRGIGDDPDESLAASVWFSQRRRPLLSPYGVGTVDQALLGTLNVKHHFVRLWGLANRVIVLDEVHAYDTYTSVLIEALVRWLKAMGSSVVLMSATLPQAKRDRLVRAWGASPDELPEMMYPRLTLIDDGTPRGDTVDARPLAPIALHGLDESLDAMADQAMALLRDGGCGAVIVNTVDRAQTLYRLMEPYASASGIDMVLFHARFPADERAEREERVLDMFGARDDGRNARRSPVGLLIATQVAEQSLDLDFDFMLSDLAPVDLILQRAGRLHRHDRVRPEAHTEARLWIAGLHKDRLPSLKETAWEYVYDPYILRLTWVCLRERSVLQLPVDIDGLVQEVYRPDPVLPESIDQKTRELIEIDSYGAHLGTKRGKHQQAIDILLDIYAEPSRAYQNKPIGGDDEDGVRNVTRLGPDSVSLVPITVTDGAWFIGGTVFDPDCVPDDETARWLYKRQLRVSRKAVVLQCQQSEQPVAFAEHPLLRHLYPLPLTDGCCDIGGQSLRLDKALGLVYEAKK